MISKVALLMVFLSSGALCQQAEPSTNPNSPASTRTEVVVVTGTFVPSPVSENERSVQSLDAQENPLLFGAAIDYLRLDPAVDLQERAPDGVQSDLSILGSTFAETL